MDQCQPRPNCETQPLWVQGILIVPNGHTLAGFAIGALQLMTMAEITFRQVAMVIKWCFLPGLSGIKDPSGGTSFGFV